MKNWFDSLQPRERMILMIGGIALLLVLLYSIIWAPLRSKIKILETSVTSKEASLRWMQQASQKIIAIQEEKSRRSAQGGHSLISVVDTSFTAAGLKTSIDRMEPDGEASVKLWLVKAGFDDLARTLGKLDAINGIQVKSISANPTDMTGRVDARVVLTTQ